MRIGIVTLLGHMKLPFLSSISPVHQRAMNEVEGGERPRASNIVNCWDVVTSAKHV
jgi:hypothetical protein